MQFSSVLSSVVGRIILQGVEITQLPLEMRLNGNNDKGQEDRESRG